MYKPLEEVQAALATRLPSENLKDVDGYSYVPWEVTTRQLDACFGAFGWHEVITNQQYDTQKGIYIVSRRLTGYAMVTETTSEGETYSHPVSIEREGVGVGIAINESGRAHDTAIKGADSDSFSRAAKKLGDAFGLFLYDRDDPARRSNNGNATTSASTRPAVTGTVTGPKGFSEKQLGFLAKLGWSQSAIDQMSYAEGKAIMDERRHAPKAETSDALPF